ncbi:4-(cytidine 5'-diphospho)-2-C-methyl-D-erythritol kinase [Cereibacter azotoformans]|uniref:4-diphosphocytidyl-2-C-methyl-D-erythritol kinase n=2 Tax=Cereibacter TaxID=1653176 RepID=ISPE_CERS5|nr:4-(cytidine 5'-diphospho)-2-C-methyl-D-erythritol kinase [Cereibacter azotoformans]A4WVE5.1 RecName: Full=4-diphosphocytidyl-2-C-methyl-D-erythritol kinase; Short=CMK; AltName: Full=4-(cytidine-5'-diphospho)-2-C-methyl-D-erythritol kinase [Cereibacter sphaeroides ATCC 17025]AXQ94341.1 4-(cytidine 5'-diphospho)-2-C-methyl-D-erythritol kinase [Cereibacter sphaeroides]MBO4167839.1 4-(cytidine 5'-diphospho)-2-C-methyl-D-erythritol kinase [Cereibacter azotoformans]PTR18401.1 4-diphosphocytidyl-2-
MTEAFARAKINLTLHVTGQRPDGYHLLDSLVVFADVGDRVRTEPAEALSLAITGPQAVNLPVSDDNLVLRAARAMGGQGARITLEKHLPVASGIGGGSADAAATLKALAELWQRPLPEAAAVLRLGADVPVCLEGRAVRMAGVGEILEPLAGPLPPAWLVLANPGVSVPTPPVFKALARRDNPPMPERLPDWGSADELAAFLAAMRNDLEAPAIALAPEVAETRAALAAEPGCLIARMSGSGATCFGLFAEERPARAAAEALRAAHPGWWIEPARMAG